MIFHDMTWPELARVDFNRTLVLVPVGSTEQHGHHLPTDTDTRIVSHLAAAVERRRPDSILLAPTMWLGHSPHHLSFGGTLSAHHSVFIDMVVSICESYAGMGAKKIWILNGHGGNRAPLAIVVQELKNRHKDLRVIASEYWNLAKEPISRLRESEIGGMGHACELETSLYLYLDETRVRRELIQDDGALGSSSLFPTDLIESAPVAEVRDFKEFTQTGVMGKPSLASKEKGEKLFQSIVEALDEFAGRLLALE